MAQESNSPIAVIENIIAVEDALGDFIANGPSTGLPGYVRDQYRKRCDQFANAPGWAQVLGDGASGTLGRVCQPWYDQGGFTGPTRDVPFTGGQCPTLYNGQITYTAAGPDCSTQNFTDTFGLGVLGPVQVLTDNVGITIPPQGLCPGFSYGNIRLIDGNGGQNSQRGSGFGARLVSVSFTRVDGLPDDCGDPPPRLAPGPTPPPDPGPTPGPEPTDDPNNPTGAPLLPIPPYDDPIGGPTPIVGPDPFAPTVGPDDLPGNPDTSPGGDENIGDPIAVDPGPGGGGDDVDFGDPPAGRSWVGCLLQFAFPPTAGIIAGSGPANPVSPRIVGNASLVYEGGRGTAERVNCGNFQLFRPSGSLKVTGVYVNVEPGFTYNVRPVSIANCPENQCISE